jgi:hypothetical protein
MRSRDVFDRGFFFAYLKLGHDPEADRDAEKEKLAKEAG